MRKARLAGDIASTGQSVADALRWGRRRLSLARTETPGLDAEVLLRHVLGLDRTALFVRLPEPISSDALAVYKRLLESRAGDVPVAYITGEREFMGLMFEVGPEVLVPRPETEILVEWALDWLRGRDRATVIDVGTGSGAIALSIAAKAGSNWSGRIVAADLSAAALGMAARNLARLGGDHRVALVQGSLVSWTSGPVDLVLANLPYLRPSQIDGNPNLAAEPRLALDGGGDGLDLIRKLLGDVSRVVAPGGAVGLEIDPSQRDEVLSLAHGAFPSSELAELRDLAGDDRHITIQTALTVPKP